MVVMRILITRIGFVALLTCICASGAMADDNYVYLPEQNLSEPGTIGLINSAKSNVEIATNEPTDARRNKRRMKFFNQGIESALRKFDGYPPIQSYEQARLSLRLAFIRVASNELIYLRRQEFSTEETPARFLELYDKMAVWAEKIILMDGAEVFHLHKQYKLSHGHYGHRDIARNLFELAIEKKNSAALWERFYEYLLKSKNEPNACAAERILKKLFTLGDHKAALELARRYKDGDRFIKDRARAVYWYAKALTLEGKDIVTPIMMDLGREFTEMDKYWLHFWRRSEVPPSCLTEPR